VISDDSNSGFRIQNIQVTSPNGSEVWAPGSVHNITWSSDGLGSVKIELLKNGALDSTIITSTANDGSYPWTIPSTKLGNDYKIRVMGLDSQCTDNSDGNFVIQKITVTTPNGGNYWRSGTTKTIQWNSARSGTVRIELLKNGAVQSPAITSSTADDGSYSWSVPGNIDNTFKIRITTLVTLTTSDDSNSNFSIENIQVTDPASGDSWQAAGTHNIQWDSCGTGNVKIEFKYFSLPAGQYMTSTVVSSTPNDGSYSWTLDEFFGATITHRTIKIISLTDTNEYDESDEFSMPAGYPNAPSSFSKLSSTFHWQDNSDREDGFKIIYNKTFEPLVFYQLTDINTPNTESYFCSMLPANIDRVYVVAYNSTGDSHTSNWLNL
jgi:hypothetical protein